MRALQWLPTNGMSEKDVSTKNISNYEGEKRAAETV